MTNFANMCVIDYCLANTDRHFENFGLLVDNKTNNIKELDSYIANYCAYNCKWFLLKKIK